MYFTFMQTPPSEGKFVLLARAGRQVKKLTETILFLAFVAHRWMVLLLK